MHTHDPDLILFYKIFSSCTMYNFYVNMYNFDLFLFHSTYDSGFKIMILKSNCWMKTKIKMQILRGKLFSLQCPLTFWGIHRYFTEFAL